MPVVESKTHKVIERAVYMYSIHVIGGSDTCHIRYVIEDNGTDHNRQWSNT